MHTAQHFHDLLRDEEDYKEWVDKQPMGADTSVQAFLDTLDEDEIKELKEKFYEQKDSFFSQRKDEDDD